VSLDRPALAAVGGLKALTAELQDADLTAAGWTVTGPVPGSDGGAAVSARHDYTSPAQASALIAELAGSGPAEGRPFRLSLARQRSFWRTETVLSGTVDLTCSLACFGDSGLTSALGFPTGVDARSLAAAAGQSPDRVFTFSLDTRLRGSVIKSNAVSLPGGGLQWTPRLGQRLQLAAVVRTWNTGHIVAVSVIAGGLLLICVGLVIFWWWRRRRRRRERRQGERVREAVAPPS
jgi:hypothetical protein